MQLGIQFGLGREYPRKKFPKVVAFKVKIKR